MRLNRRFLRRATIRLPLILLLMGFPAWLFAGTYVNPLKGDLGVHDPVMIKEGNVYRIYQTGGTIGSKRSTDRINWTSVSSGLDAPDPAALL